MRDIQIYLFFFICFLAASCNNKKGPDVSQIKLNVSIDRFDRELDALRSEAGGQKSEANDLLQKAQDLRKKYTWFYDDYMEQIVPVGSPSAGPSYLNTLTTVLSSKDYLELKSTVEKAF